MSLTSFIKRKEVVERFRVLRPQFSQLIPAPIRVLPKRERSHIVGSGFDYLLRIELKRRAPWAVSDRWAAESVAVAFLRALPDEKTLPARFPGNDLRAVLRRMMETARQVVTEAKPDVAGYCSLTKPTLLDRQRVARHSLRLAQVDVVFRAGVNNADSKIFDDPESSDVQELLDLLDIVPFDQLIHSTLLLNPGFGESSRAIGGADIDLIVGDSLIDIKTIRKRACESPSLDQLFGYYLLARMERERSASFPLILNLGIYHSRQGLLWPLRIAD